MTLFARNAPIVRTRAVHLDLKGLPPTPGRLVELVPLFRAAGFNAVLVEWEDTFPWTCDVRYRGAFHYTREQVAAFHGACAEHGVEVIPLVQCLGHMETPLSLPGNERLQEVPGDAAGLNPLAEGARGLVAAMIDDVLALTPGVRRFHLGGDEARTLGKAPETRAYIERHGKAAIYLQHVEPLLDRLRARGARPLLWHDMMIDWDDAGLARIAAKADLVPWGYNGDPDTTSHHFATKHIERFARHGIVMWGGTAYKGGDGPMRELPDFSLRQENALAWARVAQRFAFEGLIATAWSRYCTHLPQTEPIDGALDSLVNVGVILHDGAPPAGGRDACLGLLAGLGERERFDATHAALADLHVGLRDSWLNVRAIRECLCNVAIDPSRRGSGAERDPVSWMRHSTMVMNRGVAGVRAALAGRVDARLIEHFLAVRVEPIREECGTLLPRYRTIDPVAAEKALAGWLL